MELIKKQYRKYWILAIWVLILGYLVFSFGIVGSDRNSTICSGHSVIIDKGKGAKFITANEIDAILIAEKTILKGVPLHDINTTSIEKVIANHPSVKDVTVYKTMRGVVCIEIEQRKPILRIINNKSQSFYIDETGLPMPFSRNYTPHILVAGGYIPKAKNTSQNDTVPQPKIFEDLYKMAKFITEDDYWNAQIVQVYVTQKGEFELVSRVGDHDILFGGIENYERKFAKLDALYRQGFAKYGWKKYSTINLKFKNQVVCTERNK